MPYYQIKQGDTLAKIANVFGLADWKRIYSHPDNAEFRIKRPNPNLLHPGDVVFVPDQELREEAASADQRHSYVYRRPKQMLRIAVEDMDGKRIKDVRFELTVDGTRQSGTTDSRGIIEREIPVGAATGILKVSEYKWVLAIGHLNPMDAKTPDGGVSGAQGRLRNLGYPVGPIDGDLGPRTRAAIGYFQADEQLPVTGELDDATITRLRKVHGV
jgi:hypothetical protein